MLAIVSSYEPGTLLDVSRYVVGATAAALLLVAMNGQMLGLARLAYSLATNRQIPSGVGRLQRRRGTPYVTIILAAQLLKPQAIALADQRGIACVTVDLAVLRGEREPELTLFAV